jgi:hypothetical protein
MICKPNTIRFAIVISVFIILSFTLSGCGGSDNKRVTVSGTSPPEVNLSKVFNRPLSQISAL